MNRFNKIPALFADAVIAKDVQGDWNPDLYESCAKFVRLVKTRKTEGKAPFFAGKSGIGKTYACAATVNYLVRLKEEQVEDFVFVWASSADFFRTLSMYESFKTKDFWSIDGQMGTADLVVFDDFGYVSQFPRHQEAFWAYVNYRYENKKPTMFTCQYDIASWEDLVTHVGEGMTRRFMEMSGDLAVFL